MTDWIISNSYSKQWQNPKDIKKTEIKMQMLEILRNIPMIKNQPTHSRKVNGQ